MALIESGGIPRTPASPILPTWEHVILECERVFGAGGHHYSNPADLARAGQWLHAVGASDDTYGRKDHSFVDPPGVLHELGERLAAPLTDQKQRSPTQTARGVVEEDLPYPVEPILRREAARSRFPTIHPFV